MKRESTNPGALVTKARFLITDGKPADALTLANIVLKNDPRAVSALFIKGTALKIQRAYDDAVAAFQEALRIVPSSTAVLVELAETNYLKGNVNAAVEFSNQVIKRRPNTGEAHLILAKSLMRLGNIAAAEHETAVLTKADPNNIEVQMVRGDLFWAKHDLGRARQTYESVVKLQNDHFSANAGLVTIDLAEHNLDAARSRAESLLAKMPNDERRLLLAGSTYVLLKEDKKAEDAFRRAIQVNESSMEAYGRLALVYASQNRLDEARKEYEEVARRNPRMAVQALTMVGILASRQNKPEEARKAYEHALALDPKAPVASNNLAWDYAESGQNLDVALGLAQNAKSRIPDNPSVNDTLGWVYYKKGFGSLAVSSLKQSVAAQPTNPTYLYHLGLAYSLVGDQANARQCLERALKIAPNFDNADDARRFLRSMAG